MANAENEALRQLLAAQGGLSDETLQTVLDILELAPEKASKTQQALVNQVFKVVGPQTRDLVKQAGTRELRQMALEAGLRSKELGGRLAREEIQTRAAEQRKNIAARTEAKIREAAELPVAQARATQRVEAITNQPRTLQVRAQAKRLFKLIDKPEFNPAEVKESIATLGDFPQAMGLREQLEGKLEGQLATRRANALRLANETGVTSPRAVRFLEQEVQNKGLRVMEGSEALRTARRIQDVEHSIAPTLQKAGLRLAGETPQPARNFLFSNKAVAQEAGSTLSKVTEALSGGKAAEATSMLESLPAAVRGLASRRLGYGAAGIGGLLALLLGPRLLGGGQPQQPQMNPMMQLQLAKALQELQQNQQLTQSLTASRGAQAESDLARAALLRLQAAQAGAGAAPVVV